MLFVETAQYKPHRPILSHLRNPRPAIVFLLFFGTVNMLYCTYAVRRKVERSDAYPVDSSGGCDPMVIVVVGVSA